MAFEENNLRKGRFIKAFSAYAVGVVGVFGLLAYVINKGSDDDVVPGSTATTTDNTAANTNSQVPSQAQTQTQAQVKTKVPVKIPIVTKSTSTYKDGTYNAQGTYDSPAGMEGIAVSVTLQNDVVVSSTVTNQAGDRTSSRYQDKFINNFQGYVVGKNIDSINLGVIGGSSLTPEGFNQALLKIKAQAKA